MTDEQKRIVAALSRCRLLPGSTDKRFIRQMETTLRVEPDRVLTAKQDAYLVGLLHRYRKQHGACTCLECLKEASKSDQPYQKDLFGEMK